MNTPIRTKAKSKKVAVDVHGDHSYRNLIDAARRYDAQKFFVRKAAISPKQMRSANAGGLALRVYVKGRDQTIGVVKAVYRMRYSK